MSYEITYVFLSQGFEEKGGSGKDRSRVAGISLFFQNKKKVLNGEKNERDSQNRKRLQHGLKCTAHGLTRRV